MSSHNGAEEVSSHNGAEEVSIYSQVDLQNSSVLHRTFYPKRSTF